MSIVNPLTKRKIKIGSRIYNKLVKNGDIKLDEPVLNNDNDDEAQQRYYDIIENNKGEILNHLHDKYGDIDPNNNEQMLSVNQFLTERINGLF